MSIPAPGPVFVERVRRAGLEDILERLESNIRLDSEQGLRLFSCPDVVATGLLANRVRERRHGNLCYFNRNLHINATNVCEATCIFCSFSRLKTGDPQSWTLSIQQAVERVKALDSALVSEVHIVNGLNPDLPFSYYTDLLEALKDARPELHIKGFTAVEIAYYSEKYQMSTAEVLQALTQAGLDSMPGGGAEIFAHRARRKLCHDKVDGEGWLEVHRVAHQMGIRTNATMLFGSIETLEERVDHLCQLRVLQDRSLQDGASDPSHAGGRFQTFIPLRFHNDNNQLARLASPTGFDSLRTIAVSRLMLDNFSHIKAYWPMLGTQIAQVAQHFGASDLDGTVREEHIYHMAGADTPQGHTPEALAAFIRKARRSPVERDTLYHLIRRLDAPRKREFIPQGRPRVGIVGYQNSAPLVKHLCPQKLELRYGHPSEVACWLREGEVDLALLPVAALLNDQIDGVAEPAFRVIPDLAIGCHGSVDSVLIAAESPPEEWTHVLLDKVSRTSVCLARLLLTEGPLADRVPADLKILEVAPGTGLAQARGTRATVVIGDQALALSERFRHRIDLGTAWTDWTGLPFVFALWVGRKDLDLSTVECVRSAGLRGLAELRSGDLGSELSESTLDYLRTKIRYELDDAATMGLMRFAALGKRAGLLAREHFCLFPPVTESPDPEQSCAKALHDLIAGSTDLNRLTLLAEHGSLLELMAAAGLEDSPGRDVSYQALDSPRQTRPEMTQMEDLGGLQLGATGIQEGPARFEAWLGIAQELPEIDLHILPGPETLPSHWALLLFRLRALQRPFMRSIVIEDHQEGPKNTTGAEWLMTVALARLACPEVQRFVVDSSTHGAGLSQVALHGGATDLGPEGTAPDLQGPSIERNIRLAGFEPMRRNSEWLSSSGTHHREDLERPLRRLDAPSQG